MSNSENFLKKLEECVSSEENVKKLNDIFKFKKGGIYINPKNKGKFTRSAKRAGMSVQEFARHVLANKDKYSTTQVRRANFARNAKRFKHKEGGVIKSTDFIKTNNSFIGKPSLDSVRELFDNYKKNK